MNEILRQALGHSHAQAQSVVHRLSAGVKLLLALILMVGTILAPLYLTAWFLAASAVLVTGVALSRISPLFFLKRLAALSPFVLGVALAKAFQPGGGAEWLAVAGKSVFCLLTVTLLANTTPFSKILRVLQWARVPALLITTIALMHRYLFVLADEAERMRRARLSRTFTPERRMGWRTLATVVGQLFVRASERAERIFDSMCARGWK